MPLLRRQPKLKGFRNPTKERFEIIHLASLEKRLPPGSYDVFALKEARLVQGRLPVKILGGGRVTKKFTLTVDAVSQSAKKAIEEAGGSITFGEHVRD
jgi:large subunit ribosomal protein L15